MNNTSTKFSELDRRALLRVFPLSDNGVILWFATKNRPFIQGIEDRVFQKNSQI